MNIVALVPKSDTFRSIDEINDYKTIAYNSIININNNDSAIYIFNNNDDNDNDEGLSLHLPNVNDINLDSSIYNIDMQSSSFIKLGLSMHDNSDTYDNSESKDLNDHHHHHHDDHDDHDNKAFVSNNDIKKNDIINSINCNIFMIQDTKKTIDNDMKLLQHLLFECGEINIMRDKCQQHTINLFSQTSKINNMDFILNMFFVLIAILFTFGYVVQSYIIPKVCCSITIPISKMSLTGLIQSIGSSDISLTRFLCSIQSSDIVCIIMAIIGVFLLSLIAFTGNTNRKGVAQFHQKYCKILVLGLSLLLLCMAFLQITPPIMTGTSDVKGGRQYENNGFIQSFRIDHLFD